MAGLPRPLVLATVAVCLCVHCGQFAFAAKGIASRFLIVSTPRHSKIAYMRTTPGRYTRGLPGMQSLIVEGLVRPQGLAVDQKRSRLLVADPDVRKILSYPLTATETTLTAGKPVALAEGVEARWVAVDGFGNVFFTDELQNQIMKIPASQVGHGSADSAAQVVYDGSTLLQVSAPGGIAADSYHAYWANKQTGTLAGSLIQASSGGAPTLAVSLTQTNASGITSTLGVSRRARAASSLVQTMSRSAEKSYGVCLSATNVYFTQAESTIYGAKKSADKQVNVLSSTRLGLARIDGIEAKTTLPWKDIDQAHLINDKLVNPRGCAWDGDGTVYVADRGADAVYAFPGNMRELSTLQLEKTVDFEDAFGVAVFVASPGANLSSANRRASFPYAPLAYMATATLLLLFGGHSS